MGGGNIRVGTAGWSYKDWEGIFYPPGMSRRKQHPLELVARCFDVVEINTSFYGHIKPEIAKLWARIVSEANPSFLFTAKLHRSFTHSPLAATEPTSAVSIRPNDEDERLAREGLEAMVATGKFGALLIQFPVSFKNTSLNREYLETLLRQFIEYPRVVEVRHSTWNNHFEAKAGVNALQMKHMMTGRRVVAPEALLEHYPQLKSIADPMAEGQQGISLPLLA